MHQPAELLAGMDVQPQVAAQALVSGAVAVRNLQPYHRMAAAFLLQHRRPGGLAAQRSSVPQPHVTGAGQRPAVQQPLPCARRGAPFQAQP